MPQFFGVTFTTLTSLALTFVIGTFQVNEGSQNGPKKNTYTAIGFNCLIFFLKITFILCRLFKILQMAMYEYERAQKPWELLEYHMYVIGIYVQ